MEKEALNGKAIITCHHCGEVATFQIIYTLSQVGHLLMKSRGQVQTIIKEGKLQFRYQLKSGWTVRKVVDHSQLQKYLDDHLPKPEDRFVAVKVGW